MFLHILIQIKYCNRPSAGAICFLCFQRGVRQIFVSAKRSPAGTRAKEAGLNFRSLPFTNHAWSNRSREYARIALVLIDGKR